MGQIIATLGQNDVSFYAADLASDKMEVLRCIGLCAEWEAGLSISCIIWNIKCVISRFAFAMSREKNTECIKKFSKYPAFDMWYTHVMITIQC